MNRFLKRLFLTYRPKMLSYKPGYSKYHPAKRNIKYVFSDGVYKERQRTKYNLPCIIVVTTIFVVVMVCYNLYLRMQFLEKALDKTGPISGPGYQNDNFYNNYRLGPNGRQQLHSLPPAGVMPGGHKVLQVAQQQYRNYQNIPNMPVPKISDYNMNDNPARPIKKYAHKQEDIDQIWRYISDTDANLGDEKIPFDQLDFYEGGIDEGEYGDSNGESFGHSLEDDSEEDSEYYYDDEDDQESSDDSDYTDSTEDSDYSEITEDEDESDYDSDMDDSDYDSDNSDYNSSTDDSDYTESDDQDEDSREDFDDNEPLDVRYDDDIEGSGLNAN